MRLQYVSDAEPGIRRVRSGSGFRYLRSGDKPVHDVATLKRIRTLAIPPAYSDVWICPNPRGHIQATGRDARRRKQYRYHTHWRATRDAAKFDRMVEFGRALPKLRKHLRDVLALDGFPQEKVLAVVITLLDRTCVRIGNEEYARSNKSFGLTTLRNRHVKFVSKNAALLKFRGKSGLDHEVSIDDPRLVGIVRKLEELPGQHLFQYLDGDGAPHPIDSTMVNDYLQRIMGRDFTAKDFRTWNATLRAIELLLKTPLPESPSERACKACVTEVIRCVAKELRNTPAVCRSAYINPAVFDAWRTGNLEKKSGMRFSERNALQILASISRVKTQPSS